MAQDTSLHGAHGPLWSHPQQLVGMGFGEFKYKKWNDAGFFGFKTAAGRAAFIKKYPAYAECAVPYGFFDPPVDVGSYNPYGFPMFVPSVSVVPLGQRFAWDRPCGYPGSARDLDQLLVEKGLALPSASAPVVPPTSPGFLGGVYIRRTGFPKETSSPTNCSSPVRD